MVFDRTQEDVSIATCDYRKIGTRSELLARPYGLRNDDLPFNRKRCCHPVKILLEKVVSSESFSFSEELDVSLPNSASLLSRLLQQRLLFDLE